jgi:hypothetical protein
MSSNKRVKNFILMLAHKCNCQKGEEKIILVSIFCRTLKNKCKLFTSGWLDLAWQEAAGFGLVVPVREEAFHVSRRGAV